MHIHNGYKATRLSRGDNNIYDKKVSQNANKGNTFSYTHFSNKYGDGFNRFRRISITAFNEHTLCKRKCARGNQVLA